MLGLRLNAFSATLESGTSLVIYLDHTCQPSRLVVVALELFINFLNCLLGNRTQICR